MRQKELIQKKILKDTTKELFLPITEWLVGLVVILTLTGEPMNNYHLNKNKI